LYFKEQYPLIKKINPQFNLASISKEISMKWKSLSQDEKDVYVQKISEDEKYKKIKETHSNLTQTIQVTAPKDDVVEDEFSLKYFLGNHSLSEGQLKMVKSKDRYLTTKEKEEIENICLVLKDKSVESLRKMYENNYNVPVPNYWNVDTILENVYIMERRDKLIRNFETLLSKLKLKLTKSEEDEIHQKVQEWRDMESLGDYYTSIFDDDMIVRNKSEMILRLKDKMVNDFLKKKFCDTVSIHGF
jgi:hypothetical protein